MIDRFGGMEKDQDGRVRISFFSETWEGESEKAVGVAEVGDDTHSLLCSKRTLSMKKTIQKSEERWVT